MTPRRVRATRDVTIVLETVEELEKFDIADVGVGTHEGKSKKKQFSVNLLFAISRFRYPIHVSQ